MANLQTNPLALAALATAAIPRLDVVGARLDHVGADYAFAHVEDASGRIWVVRVALHQAAEAGQEAEGALLKALAGASSGGALPFEVPRPRGFADLAGGGRAMVYAALPGVPVVMELMDAGPGTAESLGRAIAAFHELPRSIVTEAGFPSDTPAEYRTRLTAEVDDAARTGHVSARLEDRWREQLGHDAWWVFTPVPIHGDMAAEHLFENSGRISAIADFASVRVSDPAEDLAQLLSPLPPDVAGSIVGAYRLRRADLDDPHLEDRAAFLGEIAIIRWLRHGIALDDPTIIKDARHMLADLDQAVAEEQAQAERAAAAEAEAAAKLEAAKQAALDEARERREAAMRASESAAREHLRASGEMPRVSDDGESGGENADEGAGGAGGENADEGESASTGGEGAGGGDAGGEGESSGGGDEPAPPTAPKRQAVTEGGVSLWGTRPKKDAPTWDESYDPDADSDGAEEPDSQEMTQAFLPDFLKDDSEAPADIAAAAAQGETEALEKG
ncbi:MAG: phosphotransferase [Bifidobacteriaceae bacterium]|nr:phosphotransferase [Bifidobacteriaceae bacterium]